MLMTFDEFQNAGTVGARLYFPDNTIQHDGIFVTYETSSNRVHLGHFGFKSHYNFTNNKKIIVGNTAALVMMRKKSFEKVGMFNESYINCFEDVELNLKFLLSGFKNYLDSNSVAYHYESKTRNEDPDNMRKLTVDYTERLFPFVTQNIEKLKAYINIK